MSKKAQRRQLAKIFERRCIICGDLIEYGPLSYDHFVPQAFASQSGSNYCVGIVFPAHQRCNSRRGHEPPTNLMIDRAADMVCELGTARLHEALSNIARLEASHRTYLDTLILLRRRIAARMLRAPGDDACASQRAMDQSEN